MNTNYTTGDTIRNSDSFTGYKPPAIRPTEEWGGNEVRSYQNYVRPIANLFENDSENNAFIKDVYAGINTSSNAVISGCEVVKTPNTTYYEVTHGAFISSGKIYYIYPACEAVAKQIEKEYAMAGKGSLNLKISYDYEINKYQSTETGETKYDTAAALIAAILTSLGLTSSVESHIILPIYNIANNTSATISINSISFATVTNGTITDTRVFSTIDGSRIDTTAGHKVKNDSLVNNTVTIGSTSIALGASSASLTDVNTINNVGISTTSQNGLKITSSYGSITTKTNYALDTACAKAFTTDTTLAEAGETAKLPTASTVKAYVDNKIQSVPRNSLITFNNGINVTGTASFANNITAGGKITVSNTENASRVSGHVSGAASIYTVGGIEAAKDIYSDGNIVGINNGTYSLRSLKENITPFKKSAVKLIDDVKIVNYNYIADQEKNHKVGFIADDTDELFATKNHNIMDQSNCIGILLKAVQELSGEIKKLKEEINELNKNAASGEE